MEDIQIGNKTEQCCLVAENLKLQSSSHPDVQNRKDLVLRICEVCGRRHFEATLDPLSLTVRAN
jgi:hypothetical protein